MAPLDLGSRQHSGVSRFICMADEELLFQSEESPNDQLSPNESTGQGSVVLQEAQPLQPFDPAVAARHEYLGGRSLAGSRYWVDGRHVPTVHSVPPSCMQTSRS